MKSKPIDSFKDGSDYDFLLVGFVAFNGGFFRRRVAVIDFNAIARHFCTLKSDSFGQPVIPLMCCRNMLNSLFLQQERFLAD